MQDQEHQTCPHCDEGDTRITRNGDHVQVECTGCGATGPSAKDEQGARSSWLRRGRGAPAGKDSETAVHHPGCKAALVHAVDAIYFNDSSDYLSAPWGVVQEINPAVVQLLQSKPREAYQLVNGYPTDTDDD